MAKQNGILSIIHAINRPDSWHKAFILYLVSENETLKPNQCHYLEIPQLIAYKCSKKASDQHYKKPSGLAKGIFFFENPEPIIEPNDGVLT